MSVIDCTTLFATKQFGTKVERRAMLLPQKGGTVAQFQKEFRGPVFTQAEFDDLCAIFGKVD